MSAYCHAIYYSIGAFKVQYRYCNDVVVIMIQLLVLHILYLYTNLEQLINMIFMLYLCILQHNVEKLFKPYLLSFEMSLVLVLPVDIINYFNTSLLLACSLPQIHNIRVNRTFLDGKIYINESSIRVFVLLIDNIKCVLFNFIKQCKV